MSHVRVRTEEGHYTIKRVPKLPKKGNANWLYAIIDDKIEEFHRWDALKREWTIITIGGGSGLTNIEEGTNIVITGTGTEADPLIINAIDNFASLQAGANITITGTGSSADPYIVTSTASGGDIPTGLEKIDEGNGDGWRLIGRNPDNFGKIGLNAVDFGVSTGVSSTIGATGEGSINTGLSNQTSGPYAFTMGESNQNTQSTTIMTGFGITRSSTPTPSPWNGFNIISGSDWVGDGAINGLKLKNNMYGNIITAWDSEIGSNSVGIGGGDPVLYTSLAVGTLLDVYGGNGSGYIGGALTGGGANCLVTGAANLDLTQNNATPVHFSTNSYNPRFIVGVGSLNNFDGITTRRNGFVVMSDGIISMPELSVADIDNPTVPVGASVNFAARVPITKEYFDANVGDLSNYVTTNTVQNITAIKTFTSGGAIAVFVNSSIPGIDLTSTTTLTDSLIRTQNLSPTNEAVYLENRNTGKNLVLNNVAGGIGMPLSVQKDSVDVATIDDTGKVTAETLNLQGLPVHANEAAAIVAGLVTGDVYMTATGELRIKL